jgi:glycosyltransferase involved in cell wall biosynthesis
MSEISDPSISIIIPVYNGGKAFDACLESLKLLDPPPFEVIVVGDGDTDGSVERACREGFVVTRTPLRQGPANARNRGARRAKGNILFFLDADVLAADNVVSRVAENFINDPGLSACFGSYDDEPADPGFISQYRNLLHHYVHQKGRAEASTFWAGCGAVRRDVFHSLNGFDTRYQRPSIEDIELGLRLKKQGCRILLDRGLLVKHLKKWTALSVIETDFFDRALPWSRLIFSETGFIDDLNLKIHSRLSVICVFALLICLFLGMASTLFWPMACLCALLLVILNRDLYRFFFRKRGALFFVGAMLWHWLYYLYSGLALGIGLVEFGVRRVLFRSCIGN